jgi:hypothetical protein
VTPQHVYNHLGSIIAFGGQLIPSTTPTSCTSGKKKKKKKKKKKRQYVTRLEISSNTLSINDSIMQGRLVYLDVQVP